MQKMQRQSPKYANTPIHASSEWTQAPPRSHAVQAPTAARQSSVRGANSNRRLGPNPTISRRSSSNQQQQQPSPPPRKAKKNAAPRGRHAQAPAAAARASAAAPRGGNTDPLRARRLPGRSQASQAAAVETAPPPRMGSMPRRGLANGAAAAAPGVAGRSPRRRGAPVRRRAAAPAATATAAAAVAEPLRPPRRAGPGGGHAQGPTATPRRAGQKGSPRAKRLAASSKRRVAGGEAAAVSPGGAPVGGSQSPGRQASSMVGRGRSRRRLVGYTQMRPPAVVVGAEKDAQWN